MPELSEATTEEFEAETIARTLAASHAAREATRQAVQDFIDADESLSEFAITAIIDTKDTEWVVIRFPENTAGQPAFWTSAASRIVDQGGQWHSSSTSDQPVIRGNRRKTELRLTALASLLP